MKQVGLRGEFQKIYTIDESEKAEWIDLALDASPSIFTWYKVILFFVGLNSMAISSWDDNWVVYFNFSFMISLRRALRSLLVFKKI